MDAPGMVILAVSVGWWIVLLYSALLGRGLPKYVFSNHYDRWCYLTSGPGWGPGGVNSIRWLRYILSDQDNDDPQIIALKAATKRGRFYVFGYFALMLLLALMAGAFVVFFQKPD